MVLANLNHIIEIDRANVFILYESGVIRDTSTNLEWIVGQDKPTTWSDAIRWINNLTIFGGGWRMPKKGEITSLRDRKHDFKNPNPAINRRIFKIKGGFKEHNPRKKNPEYRDEYRLYVWIDDHSKSDDGKTRPYNKKTCYGFGREYDYKGKYYSCYWFDGEESSLIKFFRAFAVRNSR